MPRSTFQSEKSFTIATAASRSLEDVREIVSSRDYKTKWTDKKEGSHIHEVEVLTGLKPGKLPVDVLAVECEILATQRDFSSGSLHDLLYGIPPH